VLATETVSSAYGTGSGTTTGLGTTGLGTTGLASSTSGLGLGSTSGISPGLSGTSIASTTPLPVGYGTTPHTHYFADRGEGYRTIRETSPVFLTKSFEPVIQEVIKPVEEEAIQPFIHREREQVQIKQILQPIHETKVMPTVFMEKELPAEYKPEVRMGGVRESIPFVSPSVSYDSAEKVQVMRPPIVEETIKKTVIEEIQPVIQRETIQPQLIKNIQPIFEKIVEAPVIVRETVPFSGFGMNAPLSSNLGMNAPLSGMNYGMNAPLSGMNYGMNAPLSGMNYGMNAPLGSTYGMNAPYTGVMPLSGGQPWMDYRSGYFQERPFHHHHHGGYKDPYNRSFVESDYASRSPVKAVERRVADKLYEDSMTPRIKIPQESYSSYNYPSSSWSGSNLGTSNLGTSNVGSTWSGDSFNQPIKVRPTDTTLPQSTGFMEDKIRVRPEGTSTATSSW
jgi:hypothetical protein